MTILHYCLCFLFVDPATETKSEQVTAPTEVMTAEAFCELAWARRLSRIEALEKKLVENPKTKEWRRLSDESKKKIERTLRREITVLQVNREIDWNNKYPSQAKPGEVFKMPRTSKQLATNDEYRILEVLDETSVIVQRFLAKGNNQEFVVEGLKPAEFVDNPRAPIKISGLWYKLEKRKVNGESYERITRWPHQSDVEKIWPKFLEKQEKAAKSPQQIEKKTSVPGK